METKTCVSHFGFLDFSMKRAIITQTALPACGFVLKKFHAFGWRVYRNFRVLQRVALAFQ